MTLRIEIQEATAVGATGEAGRDFAAASTGALIATGFAGCSYNQISRWCNK